MENKVLPIVVWILFAASLVLIGLRAFGVINWSWWLITVIFWLPAASAVLSVIVAMVIVGINARRDRKALK